MAVTQSMQHYIRERVTIDPDSGCWTWRRALNRQGYGRAHGFGYLRAHRLSYRAYKGEIPAGFEIDHLCRVKACVNPAHLEAVTAAENMRRRYAYLAETCVNGHPAALNDYRDRSGHRRCRTCRRSQHARANARRRNAGVAVAAAS